MRPFAPRRLTPVLAAALALTVGLALPAAAAPGDKVWQAAYNGPGAGSEGRFVARSSDGSQIFVAADTAPGTADPTDIVTIAYSAATGAKQWTATINGPASGLDQAAGIAANPAADLVYVTGSVSTASGGTNWRTTAYSTVTGAVVWSRGFASADGQDDMVSAITVGPSGGRVFVTGGEGFGSGGSAIRTIAYDARTGAPVWARRLGDAGSNAIPSAVVTNPAGNRVFVAGGLNTGSGSHAIVAAYRASDGAPQWTSTAPTAPGLPGGTNPYDQYMAAGVSPDGTKVYATGLVTTGPSSSSIITTALNAATGTAAWSKRRAAATTGQAGGITLSVGPGGGRIFVAGAQETATGSADWIVLSYAVTDGSTVWTRGIGGSANTKDMPKGAVLRPDGGRLFVAGYVQNSGSGYDGRILAFSPVDGATVWQRTQDGPNHLDDAYFAVTVGPGGGRVFVTGATQTASSPPAFSALTVAYEG